MAFLMASIAAYLAATNYSEFLLGGKGFTFDKTDPVFGLDIGFYAFDLPNIWIAWRYLTWAAFLFLCALGRLRQRGPARRPRSFRRIAPSSARSQRARRRRHSPPGILLGALTAIGVWLTRYDLLLKNNSDAVSRSNAARSTST